MIIPKYLIPRACPCKELLASIRIVLLSLSVYFYVARVYRDNYFAAHVYIMLFWDQLQPAQWYEGFLIVH